jgi:hypothetical protein
MAAIYKAERKPSPNTKLAAVLILAFPASKTVINKFLLFTDRTVNVYRNFLSQTKGLRK